MKKEYDGNLNYLELNDIDGTACQFCRMWLNGTQKEIERFVVWGKLINKLVNTRSWTTDNGTKLKK